MTASLNTDATLRVELVECQFTKEARYSISLQLSLPGQPTGRCERQQDDIGKGRNC